MLLEAMACGTPVLSTNCRSGPSEILNHGEFGELCEVGSTEALMSGIRKFAADADFGRRYTLAGRKRVEDEFSIQTAARKLEEILTQAVAVHAK